MLGHCRRRDTRIGGVSNRGRRIEVRSVIPQKIVIAVQVHADAIGTVTARGRGPAIFAPVGSIGHAVVAAIRIGLRENVNILLVDDLLNLCRGKCDAAQSNAALRPKGLAKLFDRIDENIAAASFSRMDAAQEVDARTAALSAIRDLDGVALSSFPGFVGELNKLCEARVGTGGCRSQ